MKDTFHLWAHQDKVSGEITWVGSSAVGKAASARGLFAGEHLIKLECRIVPRKSKPKLDAKDKAAAFDLWKKGGAR